MMRRWALSLLSLVACGDDVVDPANVPLEPLCGADGPVELVRLADDETVTSVRPIREGDDLHVVVASGEDPASPPSRSMVIDPCGDELVELPSKPSYLTRWDDVLIGCIDSDLVRLSSYADASPEILARRGCAARSLGERWVTVAVEAGSDAGHLVALEVDGSDVVIRGLLDDVMAYETPYFPAVHDGRALVQTRDLAVRSVDAATGEVRLEVEQAEPSAWIVDGDVIVYRPPVLDPEQPEPLVIRDRPTGAERTLDAEIPASWWFWRWDDGLLAAKPTGAYDGQRWFWLDTGREVLAPEGMRIETVRSDGLAWLSRADEAAGVLALFRWREGETPQPAWSCTLCSVSVSHAGPFLDVAMMTPYANRSELWRLDDSGGSARMLSDAVGYHHLVLDDERVLTVISGGDEHGPLTLTDGVGGPPTTLVPRVEIRTSLLTSLYGVPDEIVYEAAPADGHHALFRARIEP